MSLQDRAQNTISQLDKEVRPCPNVPDSRCTFPIHAHPYRQLFQNYHWAFFIANVPFLKIIKPRPLLACYASYQLGVNVAPACSSLTLYLTAREIQTSQ
jgi:hypothetical protein